MTDHTSPPQRIIVILGPTAGGKSDLAIAVARTFNGEIINADSMQVYRHLDAGTAKPSAQDRAAVPHHLVDVVEPTEPFTVADWLERAEALIADIRGRGKLPVVVGGTNLYLKALLEGMFEGPPADPAFRAALADVPPQELHARLEKVDPEAAARIHRNDHKRLVRALEVHHATGQPISQQQSQWTHPPFSREAQPSAPPGYKHDPILLGLHWPTEAINRRINARVKAMFHPLDPNMEDLITETRRLEAAGLLGPQAREAIGTKQVLEYAADDAMEQVKIETRRFAKAQRTWLKRYRGVHWLNAEAVSADELAKQAIDVISQNLR